VLLWSALCCLADFLLLYIRKLGRVDRGDRAKWLHYWCQTALRRLNVAVRQDGLFPTTGLIVSNHLSYLDIMVFSSLAPCAFVSKREVRSWPLFGLAAKLSGTVFVDRTRVTDTHRVADELAQALSSGVPCVLFPEGTSSDGSGVLPFRSPLLEAAVRSSQPISPAYIRYSGEHTDVAQEICYWGDMTFVPHLFRMLSKRGVRADVRFAPESHHFDDRKVAAVRAREIVLALSSS